MHTASSTIMKLVLSLMLAGSQLIVPSFAQTAPPQAYAAQKAVYHNNGRGTDSAPYFKALLKNLRNHVQAVGPKGLDAKVVNHGDGVMLLQLAATDPDLAKSLDDLRDNGVRFLVCQNTLDERKIDWKTLYGVTKEDVVPSGIAELVKLQQQGYVYVHP